MNQSTAPLKRLTPALSGSQETWSLPDLETRESWLSEARGVFHANKDRRAAEGWMKASVAARTIRLLGLVDDLEATVARQAEENAALRKERNEAQSRYDGLRRGYDQANRERVAALDERDEYRRSCVALREQADALQAQLAEAQANLRAYKIGLDALGEAYLKVKEATNG